MDTNQYSETTRVYHTNYVRNSRAITVLWGVLTICFAIINIVVFIQPHWIGDTFDSPGAGYFGLFQYCGLTVDSCKGSFDDFNTILSPPFQAASFFIGFSALLILVCILCFLLFFFMSTKVVLFICGWIQVISTLCMFLGCVVFPAGWDNATVQGVCGTSADKFVLGNCSIRWTYILAMIGIFDILALTILCFVLATRQAKLLPEYYASNGIAEKSELNGSLKDKSHLGIQPVLTVPNPHDNDRYSEYSHKSGHSRRSAVRGDFAL